MKYKHRFFMMWLALGLSQTLLDTNVTNADSLFSSGAQDQLLESDSAQSRVSRTFFEQPLRGSLNIADTHAAIWTSSAVKWQELPPTAAPPTGVVYGDFRERKGCATFPDGAGLQLCFNIVPDISSVGLNAKELQLWLTCAAGGQSEAQFVAAGLMKDQLVARFETKCGNTAQTLTVTLQPRG
ncbi:MAG: hypothetical protein HY074_05150 [Deltaproteobacteria bacterium]|nr:hypothetical protein [Deltaproteobacteria bacterium]